MAVIGQTVYKMELQFWDINISSLKYKEIYKKYVPEFIHFFQRESLLVTLDGELCSA